MHPHHAASEVPELLAHDTKTKARSRSAELARLRWRQRHLEAELAQQRDANRALTRFVAEASHELTEPLVIMESWAILLREELGEGLDPILNSRLDSLSAVAARSRLLVESLLQDARSAERPVVFKSADMRSVIEHALSLVSPDADGRAPTITVGPMPRISTNPELMSIVTRNLVANAVKYGDPENLEIDISFTRRLRGWRLSVISSGPSISEEEAQRILRRFERGTESRRSMGSGLGLSICARLVERLGGTLGVVPEPAVGNRFFVDLPDSSPA